MEYLKKVLGIQTIYEAKGMPALPNYIIGRYDLKKVKLDGIGAIFVYPKNSLDELRAIKKQLDRVRDATGLPPVLILENITYREKEYLLREKIPFIALGKQIYLPFMAVYLQERCDSERKESSEILPSAQMLLLYYIYSGEKEIMTNAAARALSLTPTSISRASRQLEDMGLIKSEKRGVQKAIFSDKDPRDLFLFAKDYLLSPVKRIIYIDKERLDEELLLSGYSALSEYSMLSSGALTYFASESISKWEKEAMCKLHNSNEQCAVELWRYDPKILSGGECVDRLSLALALTDDKDERVEEAIEEMLEDLWREIDGKRN